MVSSVLAVVMKKTFDRSKGQIQVGVAERVILGRVENFQQRGRRVAVEPVAELVDLVEHQQRVAHLGASNCLDDPPRHRADVGPPPPAAWLGAVETPVIRAARVTIVDEPADPLEAEIAQLRLLGVRGEWESALSHIDEMLATDPDNLPLSVARVDTLEAIGRHADAYEALLDTAALLERRRELDYPGEESVVPFWLEARLATLDRAAHDENNANAEPEPQ